MKTKRIVILLLVLGLVAGLEGVMLSQFRGEPSSAPKATMTPVPTDEPAASEATPTAPPVRTARPGYTSPPDISGAGAGASAPTNAPVTQAPQATRAPTQAPAPTAAPTQAPPPERVTASNSFSSNTGVSLNMNVSWTAVDLGNGTTRLSISGSVSSYELSVMSLPVSISFSGYSASLMGSSINVGSGLHSSSLFSTSMDVATGTSGTMTVTWNFNGTYSETAISAVTASDYVYTN